MLNNTSSITAYLKPNKKRITILINLILDSADKATWKMSMIMKQTCKTKPSQVLVWKNQLFDKTLVSSQLQA